MRRLALALLSLGLGMPANGLVGCTPEARHRALATVFDGVPPPGTPRPERRRRRVEVEEPVTEPLLVDEIPTEEPELPPEPEPVYASYARLSAALPTDGLGNLDWVAGVRQGVIKPRPGPEEDAPLAPILPYDVLFDPGIPLFKAMFPHEPHTYWLRCDSCHPSIFEMRAGANPVTMAKIFQGEYCGRCHGKVAFAPETGCPRCHFQLGRPAPSSSIRGAGASGRIASEDWVGVESLPQG